MKTRRSVLPYRDRVGGVGGSNCLRKNSCRERPTYYSLHRCVDSCLKTFQASSKIFFEE